MTPEPYRTSTLARRLALTLAVVVVACGCGPATVLAGTVDLAAAEVPFGELGPPSRVIVEDVEADDAPSDPGGHEEPDGPVPQSAAGQAAAYKETLDTAQRYQSAHMGQPSRRYGRGNRSGDFPVGRVAVFAVVGIVVLRMVLAGRKAAKPPVPAPAPAPARIRRRIISLACARCDRVLDLPSGRAKRRLFCPRCGTVLPTDV